MVDNGTMRAVEEACAVALGGTDLSRREEAEIYLFNLFPTYDNVPPSIAARGGHGSAIQRDPGQTLRNAEQLLQHAQTSWAKYFAATVMLSLINSHFGTLDLNVKSEIRSIAFQSLRENSGTSLITGSLARLLSSLTCLGWLEDDVFKNTVSDSVTIIKSEAPDTGVFLDLLSAIVLDMSDSSPRSNRSASKHRRTAVAFRDSVLHDLFLLSIQTMKKLTQNAVFQDSTAVSTLKKTRTSAAGLCVRCLSYDFLGTNPDDAEETVGATQIPTSWRGDVGDSLSTLFDTYMKWKAPETQPLMEAIGLLSACRKSLFPDEDRKIFVQHLLRGLTEICRSTHGLEDEGTFHELTRFLARLTVQLSELDQFSGFQTWLDNMVQLTLSAFSPVTSPTAITNLLQYWSRILGNNSNVGSKNTDKMRQITGGFVSRFIQQRLEGDDFDEDAAAQDDAQLEYFAVVARFSYKSAVQSLVTVLETEAMGPRNPARTAWLILMASFFISSRQPYGVYSDEDDSSDGALAMTVFQVMQTGKSSSAGVNLAFLKFLDSLRRTYSTESGQRYSKLYESLGTSFGITEPSQLISVTCEHAANTLVMWKNDNAIVKQAVRLLHEMSLGYSAAKNMKKLPVIQQMLFGDNMAGGLHPQIPFLSTLSTEKSVRVQFYATLARLLVANPANDGDVNEDEFNAFVRPWTETLNQLGATLQAPLQQDAIASVQNTFRHIQGFLSPISSKRAYALVLPWIIPHLGNTMLPFFRQYVSNPNISTSFLKLLCEISQNRVSRISVETSPNGVLLFRIVSEAIATYTQYVSGLPAYGLDNVYLRKIKGIQSCFRLFQLVLAGRYVNFSLFNLYNDPALRIAIQAVFKLMEAPVADIINYQKFQTACCQLLDSMTDSSFINLIDTVTPESIDQVFHTISEVLKTPDTQNASTCASVIDHMATLVYNERRKARQNQHFLVTFVERRPEILPFILLQLLQAVLLEDSSIQWSLSRPLLPLILLNPEAFNDISNTLVGMQLPHRQTALRSALNALMESVVMDSLSAKNRDTVSSNLTTARRTLTSERFVEADLASISPFRANN